MIKKLLTIIVLVGIVGIGYLFLPKLPSRTESRYVVEMDILKMAAGIQELKQRAEVFPVFSNAIVIKELLNKGLISLPEKRHAPDGAFLDVWGNPYELKKTEDYMIIYSFGPNRRDDNGEQDDIVFHFRNTGPIYPGKNDQKK